MKIHPKSAWTEKQITDYLTTANTPIRLAWAGSNDYPMICSLWFFYGDGSLWSASHKNSHLIRSLKSSSKVAFEISNNEFPYYGVRGQANTTLIKDDKVGTLDKVIEKYLRGSNQSLASWLMSRQQDEYSIKIDPISINAWDFSERMEARATAKE